MSFETLEPKKSISMFVFFFFHSVVPSVISYKSIVDIKIHSLSCTFYVIFVLTQFSRVQLFETLWTVALQALLSLEFSIQE